MSQSALAEALNLTFQQVQKYERGSNRVSASMLVKTARKLETTVASLVGEGETEKQSVNVYQALTLPGALELLSGYANIQEADVRRAFVTLVTTLNAENDEQSNAA